MTKSSRQGREGLVSKIRAAFHLGTKKEAEAFLNIFISCLEETLVQHLAEDAYSLKLNGLGKFIVHHKPPIRRTIGFSGETREIPSKRKVKFVALGKLRRLETADAER